MGCGVSYKCASWLQRLWMFLMDKSVGFCGWGDPIPRKEKKNKVIQNRWMLFEWRAKWEWFYWKGVYLFGFYLCLYVSIGRKACVFANSNEFSVAGVGRRRGYTGRGRIAVWAIRMWLEGLLVNFCCLFPHFVSTARSEKGEKQEFGFNFFWNYLLGVFGSWILCK